MERRITLHYLSVGSACLQLANVSQTTITRVHHSNHQVRCGVFVWEGLQFYILGSLYNVFGKFNAESYMDIVDNQAAHALFRFY